MTRSLCQLTSQSCSQSVNQTRKTVHSISASLTALSCLPSTRHGCVVADPMTSWQNPAARFRYSAEGVRRVPDQSFNDLLTEQLHGELPGNLGRLQPSANLRKSWMDNEFHRRAKDNFRYWLTERPAPTQCELQHPPHTPHPHLIHTPSTPHPV